MIVLPQGQLETLPSSLPTISITMSSASHSIDDQSNNSEHQEGVPPYTQ